MKRVAALGAILLCSICSSAEAATFEIAFTADQFKSLFNDVPTPPADPVSGTTTYQAANLGANIDSLTAISLTIAGHTYALSEIGFISPFFMNENLIGGTVNGVNAIENPGGVATDDFFLDLSLGPAIGAYAGNEFDYSATGTNDAYASTHFSNFSISEVPPAVPLPATLPLFATGLGGLGLLGWRRKRKAQAAV
jgi:hypothetical protein